MFVVTLVLVLLSVQSARDSLTRQLDAGHRERQSLLDQGQAFLVQSAALQQQIHDLTATVASFRAQLVTAGIPPNEVVLSPGGGVGVRPAPSTTTTTEPPRSTTTTRPTPTTTTTRCRLALPVCVR